MRGCWLHHLLSDWETELPLCVDLPAQHLLFISEDSSSLTTKETEGSETALRKCLSPGWRSGLLTQIEEAGSETASEISHLSILVSCLAAYAPPSTWMRVLTLVTLTSRLEVPRDWVGRRVGSVGTPRRKLALLRHIVRFVYPTRGLYPVPTLAKVNGESGFLSPQIVQKHLVVIQRIFPAG